MRKHLFLGLAFLGWLGCSSANSGNASYYTGDPGDPGGTPGGGTGYGSGGGGTFDTGTGTTGTPSDPSSSSSGSASSSSGSSSSSSGSPPDAGTPAQPGPGVLTAGIWDDSLNYTWFTDYLASHNGIDGDPGFVQADYDQSHTMFAQRSAHSVVDAALVIDTTGSMSDELNYLTSEFANISSAIATAFPGAQQRWALVVYRDTPDTDPGDDYVVKSYDFTTDMTAFAATVGAQYAANGGDYPESPEIGIEQLQQLSWRNDPSVAKVAFWVADAPQHDYRAAAMKKAILDTRASGIHMYPVSASGTDDLLELTMRSAAEITGGRYLFLTDDSGVGDPHKVPEIPCYYVTRLSRALVRTVAMELSGTYIGPDAADVIRTAGNPSSNGTCSVGDGGTVTIF